MQQEKHIIKIEKKETEGEGNIGKYLNKHIVPGYMYVVEDDTNLVGSCLYNIDKPMMVVTYKSYEQFLKDATKSEIAANLSDSEKTACNISDEMIADKQLELVDKPINYKTSIQILNDMDLFTLGLQMKGHKVILIDDYQTIVEDWYQEWPQKPTALQRLSIEYGITVIASKCPLTAKVDAPVEMVEPVLWTTDKYSMENRFETTEINIVRMSFGVNDDLGTALKRSLVPSQLYIIDKTPEIATSFYYSLDEPSVIFSLTKSSTQFFNDLLWSRVEAGYQTGGFDLNDIGKRINALINRPMWIDDSKIQSIEELHEKCLQMKEERNIQFAVIDDFQRLVLPNSDETLWQLCKIAQKFDIVLVGMKRATCDDTDEHHQPRRRRKRNQAKGLDAILRAGYAE